MPRSNQTDNEEVIHLENTQSRSRNDMSHEKSPEQAHDDQIMEAYENRKCY